ncbi:MAG: 30S ribosomal protein S1, partial [Candidatus Nanopelagicales bacterium]
LSLKQANEDAGAETTDEFDPYLYGMPASYDEQGAYIGPEGFDPVSGEWKEGFEDQRTEWERQYNDAYARWEQHKTQIGEAKKADAEAAETSAEGASSFSSDKPEDAAAGALDSDANEALQALRDKLSGAE